ncbi:MAG: hypothetical protein HOV94_30055 [Saccharothrix sp.]|nr:hypothetical protein [Saccharothrix sp.]
MAIARSRKVCRVVCDESEVKAVGHQVGAPLLTCGAGAGSPALVAEDGQCGDAVLLRR